MPFALAISTHPVSAYATGEVIGEIFERLGPAPDLLIVVARPGHGGAMEDITSTARRLLEPGLMIGGVADGVGGPESLVSTGPALALWAARGGRVEAFGPDTPGPSGAFALRFDAGGGETGDADLAARVRGPLVAGDRILRDGQVGVAFHASWAPTLFTLPRLVPVGPPLAITKVSGRRIIAFDDQPALPRLVEVLRDQGPRPFGGIPSIGLRLLRPGDVTGAEIVMIAGSDRETGDVVLADDVQAVAGDLGLLHVPARDGFDRLNHGFVGGADADGALVFTAHAAEPPIASGDLDPERTPLPAASLIVASAGLVCAPADGAADRSPAAAIAVFSEDYFPTA